MHSFLLPFFPVGLLGGVSNEAYTQAWFTQGRVLWNLGVGESLFRHVIINHKGQMNGRSGASTGASKGHRYLPVDLLTGSKNKRPVVSFVHQKNQNKELLFLPISCVYIVPLCVHTNWFLNSTNGLLASWRGRTADFSLVVTIARIQCTLHS
jgi:hypothetical protein